LAAITPANLPVAHSLERQTAANLIFTLYLFATESDKSGLL
jgi:hypothetical protein